MSSCNADADVHFSKAAMNVTADASFAVAEVFLYRGVFSDILQHSTLTPKSALQSLECLEKFLLDGKFKGSVSGYGPVPLDFNDL